MAAGVIGAVESVLSIFQQISRENVKPYARWCQPDSTPAGSWQHESNSLAYALGAQRCALCR
jgi:hypothetical protein